jgi:hypothetical protein
MHYLRSIPSTFESLGGVKRKREQLDMDVLEPEELPNKRLCPNSTLWGAFCTERGGEFPNSFDEDVDMDESPANRPGPDTAPAVGESSHPYPLGEQSMCGPSNAGLMCEHQDHLTVSPSVLRWLAAQPPPHWLQPSLPYVEYCNCSSFPREYGAIVLYEDPRETIDKSLKIYEAHQTTMVLED